MKRPFLLLVIFCVGSRLSEASQCAVPNQLKTRIFDSIVHYQANKVPFNFSAPDWAGSDVEFNCSTIDALPKNVFMTYDSQSIIKMKLSAKQIRKIDEDAFLSLDCVHELSLDRNAIAKLSRHAFRGLLRLERLDLSRNSLELLPDLLFADLRKLKILNLSRNRVRIVEPLAFENLGALEDLDLELNQLRTVTSDVFVPLRSLKGLRLASNRLGDVEPEKWANLSKLEDLNLADNGLTRFDPGYNFSFVALKSLNLSCNRLTELNVAAILEHLPNLQFIDLNDNPWLCDDLKSVVNELTVSKIKLASGNFSTVAVRGIACKETYYTSSTEVVTSSPTTNKHEPWTDRNYFDRMVEKKIKENNEKIKSSIGYLQKLVVFLFVVVFVFVILEIFVRADCCRVVYNRFRGRNGMYFDNSNVENFRLLHR